MTNDIFINYINFLLLLVAAPFFRFFAPSSTSHLSPILLIFHISHLRSSSIYFAKVSSIAEFIEEDRKWKAEFIEEDRKWKLILGIIINKSEMRGQPFLYNNALNNAPMERATSPSI